MYCLMGCFSRFETPIDMPVSIVKQKKSSFESASASLSHLSLPVSLPVSESALYPIKVTRPVSFFLPVDEGSLRAVFCPVIEVHH